MVERMSDAELELVLRDLGQRLRYPSPTRLADAVRARLQEARPVVWWRRVRLAPALVTAALLLVVLALASPGLRAAAQTFFHLRGIDIFPVPSVPSVAPSATQSAPVVQTGERTMSLSDARRIIPFAIRVPAELGDPDEVLVDATRDREHVILVYRQLPNVPQSQVAGIAAEVVEFRGTVEPGFFGKLIGPDTTITDVLVNGGRGFWIEGAPHVFFYRGPNGEVVQETVRLAGNTLIWEASGVTLRLEAQVSKDDALRIASSMR